MATPAENLDLLVHSHLFGLKVDVGGNLQYLDENLVLYPCGHSSVIYNTETRVQTFIHGTLPSTTVDGNTIKNGISALAVAANRRVLAIAERAAVNLYDVQTLRRRRVLSNAEHGSEIRLVSFSKDGNHVLVAGGLPDWSLVVWSTDRTAKIAATMRLGTEVKQADFCPTDTSVICVSGFGILRLLKVAEGAFKPVPLVFKREPADYTGHAWLPADQLVVATALGELLLFENYEFKTVLRQPDGEGIFAIVAHAKGFVCGGAGGLLRIFERSDDPREEFRCTKSYRVEGDESSIKQISLAPSEENLVCSTLNHMAYTFALGSTDIVEGATDPGFRYFETLTGCEAHGPSPLVKSAAINSMDVCVWKPILATCGRDQTVRIWNYKEKTMELTKHFKVEPLSISMHPSGLFLVVGFVDKVRIMSILMDDLRVVREVSAKACRECRFSTGGHAIAIAAQSAVFVVDFYTGATKFNLRAHQQAVRSVQWADKDRKLVTVGKDGNAFLWDARTGARIEETMQPRTAFTTAVLAGDAVSPSSQLFAVAADNTIKAFGAAALAPDNQIQSEVEVSCMVTATNGRALIVGTAGQDQPGTLISYILKDARFPGKSAAQTAAANKAVENSEASKPGAMGDSGSKPDSPPPPASDKGTFPPPMPASSLESQVCVGHSCATTAMCLSEDGSLLFSGGEDGSLCMFHVREVDGRGVVRLQTGRLADGTIPKSVGNKSGGSGATGGEAKQEPATEVLVLKSKLVAQRQLIESLGERVEELVRSNEHQLRQKDMAHSDRVAGVTSKFTVELQGCQKRFRELMGEKEALEAEYESKLEKLRASNAAELATRKEQYKVKIATERSRKDLLQEDRKEAAKEWEASMVALDAEQSAALQKLKASFEAESGAAQRAAAALRAEKSMLVGKWAEVQKHVEADSDAEVDGIKATYEQRLRSEQAATTALKEEHVVMKKKYQSLVKDVKEQEDKIKRLNALESQLKEVVLGLDKDIAGHKKEVREREETVGEKDKRIYELKKKNTELEKFKFVLDYKIKELKRQIEPRENEIADMRTQVEEMDLELEQYHKSNAALDLMIGELKLKIDGIQREADSSDAALRASQAYLVRFRGDLKVCAQSLGQYKPLKAAVRHLFAKYVQEEGNQSSAQKDGGGELELDPQMEYNRERDYLEKNVEALKHKISKDMELLLADHSRLTREGVNLTEEMNLLRREAKLLRRQQKSMDLENASIGKSFASTNDAESTEAQRELEMQEGQLVALESRARELQALLR